MLGQANGANAGSIALNQILLLQLFNFVIGNARSAPVTMDVPQIKNEFPSGHKGSVLFRFAVFGRRLFHVRLTASGRRNNRPKRGDIIVSLHDFLFCLPSHLSSARTALDRLGRARDGLGPSPHTCEAIRQAFRQKRDTMLSSGSSLWGETLLSGSARLLPAWESFFRQNVTRLRSERRVCVGGEISEDDGSQRDAARSHPTGGR